MGAPAPDDRRGWPGNSPFLYRNGCRRNSAGRRPGFPPDLGRIRPRGPLRPRNSRRPAPPGRGSPRSPRGPASRRGRGGAFRFPGTPAGFPGAERPNGAGRALPRPHIETDAAETLPDRKRRLSARPRTSRSARAAARPAFPPAALLREGHRVRCEGPGGRVCFAGRSFVRPNTARRRRRTGDLQRGGRDCGNSGGTGGASGFARRPVTAAGARERVGGRIRENRGW